MHVRISLLTGASDIDGGIEFLRDQVVPQLQQQKGFRGLSASGDRSAGKVNVLTMWDSEADLDASESTADKARGDAVKVFGGQATVERYEQMVWEVGSTPPGPGAKLHIRRVSMDPGLVDDNVQYFRNEVLPQMQATPGFLAARFLVDRRTGRGSSGTLWADEDARREAVARSDSRRGAAQARGIEFGEDSLFDMLFATAMRP